MNLINCLHGILYYIITYTLSLGHCPQKLLTTIFWISILTFTRIHSVTSLWPSLLSYLPATASPTSSVQLSKNESANSHRPIGNSQKQELMSTGENRPSSSAEQLAPFRFAGREKRKHGTSATLRIDGCDTRRDIKPDANGTLKRDNSLSRQRKGTDHFRDSARQMLLPKRETEQSPTSKCSLTQGIKGQKRIPF